MYIAMNRFKGIKGHEEEFERRWLGRDTYLDQLPGFDPEIASPRTFRDRDVPAIEHLTGVSPQRAPVDEAALKRLPVDE